MHKRVVVTGVGMVTALGNSAALTWQRAVDGVSGTGPVTRFDVGDLPPEGCIAAEVQDCDPSPVRGRREQRRVDRSIQDALVAADAALREAGLEGLSQVPDPDEAGVIIGSGIGGIGTILDTAQLAAER